MIAIECPWCAEPVELDIPCQEFACARCGILVEIAPDPEPKRMDRAA